MQDKNVGGYSINKNWWSSEGYPAATPLSMSLIPGKRCPRCRDGSCGQCVRGFIIKRRFLIKPRKSVRVRAKAPSRPSKDKEYSARRQVFLLANPRCLTLGPNGPCNAPTTDVHHRKGRGRYLLEESTWWACCSNCHHLAIHARPEWAHRMRYLLNRANDTIEPPSQVFLPISL